MVNSPNTAETTVRAVHGLLQVLKAWKFLEIKVNFPEPRKIFKLNFILSFKLWNRNFSVVCLAKKSIIGL